MKSSIRFKSQITLVLIILVCLSGCKKEPGEGEYEVEFTWTPYGSGTPAGTMVVTYAFHCVDHDADFDCDFFYFEDVPHISGNWMSIPKEGGACSEFIAVVKKADGTEYVFMGQLLKPLNDGVLSVSGSYDMSTTGGASEVGTFTATSNLIEGGTRVCNPD